MRTHRDRLLRAVGIAGALVLFGLGPVNAQHGPATPGGPYKGYSSGSVVHVDAVSTDSARVVDVEVGLGQAAVDSEGLAKTLSEYRRPVVPSGLGAKHSRGHSTILEVGALLQPPDADNLVKPFVAESNGPGGERVDDVPLSTTISPALHVDLLRRIADAKWNNGTCVIGEPISTGEQHIARAQLIGLGDSADSEDLDDPLVALDADQAGPRRATSHVVSREQLFVGGGDGLGLQSVTATTLAPVTFLDGTPQEFTVEVDGPAFLSVSADGTNGGADAIYRAPIVSVIQQGDVNQVLPSAPVTITVPGTGDVIAQVKLGVIESLPTPKGLGGDDTKLANGTRAAAQAHVVEVKLLDLPTQSFRGATVALGHMEAAANVPEGGIVCPIPVAKRADPEEVSVGDTFTTTITIRNPFACDLVGVSLSDAIDTVDDARFAVGETEPDASSASGGEELAKGTVSWSSLGTIKAGKSKAVEVVLDAQGGAGVIEDTATATGKLDNCPAGLGDADADVTALAEVKVDVAGKGTLEVPEAKVLGREFKKDLPRTGVGAAAPGVATALLGLAGLGAGLLRRRRA